MQWTVRGLILPYLIVVCVLLAAAGPARASKNAQVEIGFVGVPPKSPTGIPAFQNVLLNVQNVRINPNPNAGPGSAQWQNIPVPPGIGNASQSSELQVDLNASQNVPLLFNTANVRSGTYKLAELRLDPNNPGTLIPNCPQSTPIGHNSSDGCINYPIQLSSGLIIDTSGSGILVTVGSGQIASLVLQVTMQIVQAPTTPGGAYTVNVTIAPLPNSVLGTVTGSVKVTGSSNTTQSGVKLRKLAVTAEAIGSGIPIATARIKNGNYTLLLPAASGAAPPGFGSLYDIAVAGGGDTYAAARLPPLYPNTSQTANFSIVTNKTIGNITGTVSDGCQAAKPIVGATLQLLIPPDNISNPPENFCLTAPDQCVVVAIANTDNSGNFPLPGMITTPAEFDNVPDRGTGNPYTLEVSAPGYQTQYLQALPGVKGNKAGGTCAPIGSSTFAPCGITLQTAYLSGSIPIVPPPPGQTTLVQVFAEDHDTNNVEGVLDMPISVTNNNPGLVSYTLNVPPTPPDTAPSDTFDLFATTIDLYQGSVDPYQGHNIVAISNVAAPGTACDTGSVPTPSDAIECVGHGSVIGSVANPNLGTSVVLEKLDPDGPSGDNAVQITSSMVQNQQPNTSPSNNYAFCAPADTYQLEEYQLPTPEPSVTPSAAPTPSPVAGSITSVTIPPPPVVGSPSPTPGTPSPTPTGGTTPTATPSAGITCPTTCSNPNGTCPGICNTVVQPLPAP